MANAKAEQVVFSAVHTIRDLISMAEDEAARLWDAKQSGIPAGLLTGFPRLDKAIGTYLQPGIYCLQGSSGVGKSALALQIACNCGGVALFVSCEQSPLEQMHRLMSRLSAEVPPGSIYTGHFKDGTTHPDKVKELAEYAASQIPDLLILDATRYPMPALANPEHIELPSIEETARPFKDDGRRILVVVDSLHSWACSGIYDGINETENLITAITDLQRLSHTLNCTVLVLNEQTKKANEGGEGGLYGGAGTRKIAYCAEAVIELMVKDEDRDTKDEYAVIAKCQKNRHGRAGQRVAFMFNPSVMTFREGSAMEQRAANNLE